MKRIWKYRIQVTDEQRIEIPFGSVPIHAGLDPDGNPSIWYEVNPQETTIHVRIFVVGTGDPIPYETNIHIGSFVQGPFVWHVYV